MPQFNWNDFNSYRAKIETIAKDLTARNIHAGDRYATEQAEYYRQHGINPNEPIVAQTILLTVHLFLYEQTAMMESQPAYQIPEIERFVKVTSRMFGLFIRELLRGTEGVPPVRPTSGK